VLAIRI